MQVRRWSLSQNSRRTYYFTELAAKFETPAALLDELDEISSRHRAIRVVGCCSRLIWEIRSSSIGVFRKGGGRARPDANKNPFPGSYFGAVLCCSFTFSEATKMLVHRHGSMGGRNQSEIRHSRLHGLPRRRGPEFLGFWLRKVKKIPQDQRALLYLERAFATMRLQVLSQSLSPKGCPRGEPDGAGAICIAPLEWASVKQRSPSILDLVRRQCGPTLRRPKPSGVTKPVLLKPSRRPYVCA